MTTASGSKNLQSTNGTKKNGERITRAKIMPGDEVSVGPLLVSVHIVSSVDEDLRGFDGHDRFVAALGDEITRARTFGRPLALMLVRGPKAANGHVNRWANRLRVALRPVDRVGLFGPSAVLVALPEATADALQSLMAKLAAGDPPLQCGAVTFPTDGGSPDELIAALQVAKRSDRSAARDPLEASAVIIKNTAMKQVMATVKRLAQSTIAVLINGETGAGKEVIARAIHDGSPRKKKPLRYDQLRCDSRDVDRERVVRSRARRVHRCGESRRAASSNKRSGGTVLLDEIGELAPSAQAALLRVLETKTVTRVGGDKEIAVDVRVIAATHRDLEAMVAAGRFREDLLYRLNTMTLRIPPLRERVDEIAPLAERFLKDANEQAGTSVRTIDPRAMTALESYSWPGNVRELRNAIERAVVLAEGGAITPADLTDRITGGATRAQTVDPEAAESG